MQLAALLSIRAVRLQGLAGPPAALAVCVQAASIQVLTTCLAAPLHTQLPLAVALQVLRQLPDLLLR